MSVGSNPACFHTNQESWTISSTPMPEGVWRVHPFQPIRSWEHGGSSQGPNKQSMGTNYCQHRCGLGRFKRAMWATVSYHLALAQSDNWNIEKHDSLHTTLPVDRWGIVGQLDIWYTNTKNGSSNFVACFLFLLQARTRLDSMVSFSSNHHRFRFSGP